MAKSLVDALVCGLNKAHERREIDGIARDTGVCKSTIQKVRSGSTKNVYTTTTEKLWVALYHRGHLPSEFLFPVDTSLEHGEKNSAA